MSRELQELNNNHGVFVSPTPKEPTLSSSFDRISPVLLLVIVILAAVFFISGLLHLLVRYLTKRPSFSPVYNSNRFPDSLGSRSLRRQLQQLFRQHDSGLDQSSIEALPVFYYRDIIGLKEPFDCAVCLSEFMDRDKLRLIPVCGHAFHLDCIDTWLLSNSTCPLCRQSLLSTTNTSLPVELPLRFRPETILNQSMTINEETETSSNDQTPVLTEREKRVFSVRLGKFRSGCNEGQGSSREAHQEEANGYNIGRRCYSMGTVQYVVGDSNLLVALPGEGRRDVFVSESHIEKNDECSEGKKIKGRIRGDSFSVSKIWLWSKKNKIPNSSFVDASEIARYV